MLWQYCQELFAPDYERDAPKKYRELDSHEF